MHRLMYRFTIRRTLQLSQCGRYCIDCEEDHRERSFKVWSSGSSIVVQQVSSDFGTASVSRQFWRFNLQSSNRLRPRCWGWLLSYSHFLIRGRLNSLGQGHEFCSLGDLDGGDESEVLNVLIYGSLEPQVWSLICVTCRSESRAGRHQRSTIINVPSQDKSQGLHMV